MAYVEKLKRPYDVRSLIEAYLYTQRTDFVHDDFKAYYTTLFQVLQKLFDVQFSLNTVPSGRQVLWLLFESTARSLLRITSPWDDYLETGLLITRLDETGEPGVAVHHASRIIQEANSASRAAHLGMLHALFEAVFGISGRVVTSEHLAQAGFDDSKEPDITDYWESF
jgi:hypothetical protein